MDCHLERGRVLQQRVSSRFSSNLLSWVIDNRSLDNRSFNQSYLMGENGRTWNFILCQHLRFRCLLCVRSFGKSLVRSFLMSLLCKKRCDHPWRREISPGCESHRRERCTFQLWPQSL